jgi:hypothetical protein
MFFEGADSEQRRYYETMLQTLGSLSKLFSEGKDPFLYYRVAENLFCKSFNAENLSRSDTSADASLNKIGFGLKTFLRTGVSKMEKVAEFNAASSQIRSKPTTEDRVKEIARLRNNRIETTQTIYGLNSIMYHCVLRSPGKMEIVEEPMTEIDEESVAIIGETDKSISFRDSKNEYSFNYSKSTLLKRFRTDNIISEIPIDIIDDPFKLLESIGLNPVQEIVSAQPSTVDDVVCLPMYSLDKEKNKFVFEKSGLNQWNASGRVRDMNEVYIPIPAWVHKVFPRFFPGRDESFELVLPNKRNLSAKLCQENSKALMSNPNEALGEWLLRDVLKLNKGELLTYQKLEEIGLDSVIVTKIGDGKYKIDFAKIGEFERFKELNNRITDDEEEDSN